ncbi:unnamed protein product [Microthlaspi erraticum]|uniref:Zinc finger PHD-type domain-containing protein n=1 Tax=Microthlaspi erraticum TaxID=1685480 RepID=A0A6D2KYN7_9BRAS|nr:unnamed protein product [Microthlaspi erraticum]
MIRTNGYGHWICVNGMEGGSKHLCGREIVDLWDRICTNLGARMITVEDISKKRSLDLRLLYGIAYGHSWFGRCGYKFIRGSYGGTKSDYENAIELLGSLEIDQVDSDFNEHKQFKEQSSNLRAAVSSPLMDTHQRRSSRLFLKKSDAVENEKSSQRFRIYSDVAANLGSRWPVRRLEYAAEVIVESLKEMKSLNQNGMTRQDVRDAARLHIGADVHGDLLLLYTNVLLDYPESKAGRSASQVILDIFDLKQAIEDTYCILTNFTVSEIDEIEEDDDGKLLFGRVETCYALKVRGFGIDLESKLKFQGGCDSDTWMVKCVCKARDDDGERMISFDVCEVWQHTRCCGIDDDSDTWPPLYVCSNCCEEFALCRATEESFAAKV